MEKKNILSKSLFGVSIGGYTIDAPIFGSQFNSIDSVLDRVVFILNYFVGFSVIVAIAILVYGGYTLIMAGGNPDEIEKGQKAIQFAVVGMIIVFLARVIIEFVLEKFLA